MERDFIEECQIHFIKIRLHAFNNERSCFMQILIMKITALYANFEMYAKISLMKTKW
uniref:Uncharacterized protein n=1 Tax=Ascaris lumbricoides TaxID=6252 RepID=A0A0M3ISH2_ASCLU